MGTVASPAAATSPRTAGLLRWGATFLAFPPVGYLVVETVGAMDAPLAGLLGGAIAGAVIGAAQWLALRKRVGTAWIGATAAGLAVGTAAGVALNGGGTEIADLLVLGAAQGLAVGVAQRLVSKGLMWPELLAVVWPLGWLATWAIGVDVERGYVVPGASGAIVITALTALMISARR